MPFFPERETSQFFLERSLLKPRAIALRDAYATARPYPHAVLDHFLGEERARTLANAFPSPSHPGFLRRDHEEQSARLGQLQRKNFEGVDASIRHLLNELNGMAFIDFLQTLTGIEGLIPDPHFRGAGISLTLPGGHLALHADFNRDRTRHLRRRVTALYYLAADWQPSWGGALELWNASRTACEASYLPLLDRLIVMEYGDTYWHGHPAPLTCPEGRFRASISAYFYTAEITEEDEKAHSAIWAKDA